MTDRVLLSLTSAKKIGLTLAALAALAVPLLAGIAYAQSTTPKYEVAQIRPSQDCANGPIAARRHGSIAKRCAATTAPGENIEALRGPVLQAILEERFHLKVTRATKEVPVYALSIAKGGAKLQPSQIDCFLARPEGPPQTPKPG